MKGKFFVLLSILAVMCWVVVAFSSGAQATAVLFLDDNAGNSKLIADGSVFDLNPAVGVVTFIGALGVWDINVSTGISSSPFPHIDLNSVDRSTAAGRLVIAFSDKDFQASSPTGVAMKIGGTTVGTVTNLAYFDPNNLLFQDSIIGIFPGLTGAFSQSFSGSISPEGPFSLTEYVVITHTGAGISSFNAELNVVPVPPSALLLGSGLLGLVGWRFKSRKI